METTWKIRPNARWHDGAPFTADDILFTLQVLGDPELDFVKDLRVADIEAVEAPDPVTVTVRWKRLSIEANELFATKLERGAPPLPKHILEEPYLTNKAAFASLPFWSTLFVGAGPYRVQEWVPDSHAVLAANEDYVLGRPKIDQIEVRFIPSSQTLLVNVLAGEVEMSLGRGISLEQAATARDQWRAGSVLTSTGNPRKIIPQHRNPTPAVLGQVGFRRALYHALDRAEMAPALTAGFGVVAHSGLPLDDPVYRQAGDAVVKYDYDPTRAVRLIEEAGLTRGPDGMFQNPAGQLLSIEIRTGPEDLIQRTSLAVADQWRRVGIATELVEVPTARANDREYTMTFPGFNATGGNFGNFRNLKDLRSAELATPENGYRGRNTGGYATPDLDALVDRFFVTLPLDARTDVLRAIVHQLTDQVVVIHLFSDARAALVANRIANVRAEYFGNAHEWDVR
jgi:peptide/nickel transport system substrate-binding protein